MMQVQPTHRSSHLRLARPSWLLPGPLALALFSLARRHPAWVERHYVSFIGPLLRALTRLTAYTRIPLAPWLLGGAILAILLLLLRALKHALEQRSPRPLGRFIYVLTVCAGLAYAWFVLFWGLHYHREPLESRLEMTVDARSPHALRSLCAELAEQAVALRTDITALRPEDALQAVPAAFERAREHWPLWPANSVHAPKSAGVNGLLSRWMIEGIYSPFTMEALVNTSIPPVDLPFTACHEAAHSLGFAREDEANLIAYLVCSASDDPYLRYSGTMGALRYALPALGEADAAAFWACMNTLSPEVKADMAARDAFWLAAQQGASAQAAQHLNENYLSIAMQQPQGAQSYGRVVDLLLAMAEE